MGCFIVLFALVSPRLALVFVALFSNILSRSMGSWWLPLLGLVAGTSVNIIEVSHVREGIDLHVRETGVELVLETRGDDHAHDVLNALQQAGYETRVLR